jgi:hypothetical protein
LSTEDLQLYFKRLRKLHFKRYGTDKSIPRIKYFAAGEYGTSHGLTSRWRPHYHIIAFNATEHDLIHAWSYEKGRKYGSIGDVHIGNIDHGSIRYCTKYIGKAGVIPAFKGDDRTRERRWISQGIGSCYLTAEIIAWHRADMLRRYYVPLNGGLGTILPRYYANVIYDSDERKEIGNFRDSQDAKFLYEMLGRNPEYLESVRRFNDYKSKKMALNKPSKFH